MNSKNSTPTTNTVNKHKRGSSELVGCVAAIIVIIGVIVLVGLITLIPAAILWAIYNKVLVPEFHWKELGFWTVFFILWAVGIVGRALRGGSTTVTTKD